MGCGSGGATSSGCDGCPVRHVHDWLGHLRSDRVNRSFNVVQVMFKAGRKAFYETEAGQHVYNGDEVIVGADRGIDYGTVHLSGEMARLRFRKADPEDVESLQPVVRVATERDRERFIRNREKDDESFHVCRRSIKRLDLPMKLVDAEWQFDHKKVIFYFTADNRVDFRALVRDLARRFRTRVELRQIGARDEAARTGGIGSCGRELCCSTWIQEFKPVSTHAAKVQNLPLNPTRLSGQCGRLKCCLNYELDQYVKALRRFPELDTRLQTDQGAVWVRKLDIFKDIVWVQDRDGNWRDIELGVVGELVALTGDESSRDSDRREPHSARRGPDRESRR